ncbi:probable transmembrane glycoprotein / HTH domain protein [Halobacterium hubeiense]|uniref:Probable transmembrane glycoprotein / HTH domain protein n=1 Tax=Halobacterium hubeiense TaxID=1407499 RepID=A0A0U5D0T9_9EURY|nr:hypothetical protein [Halobacterium hubeiense]CQH61337.1 probable transmembrane glycoprotein / HTH domain protein [Halobacterium hubeiense]
MRQAALLVAVVCLLAVPVAGAVGAPAPQSAALQEDAASSPSGVDITVQIQSDGAARWTVSSKYSLEDDNATAAFEQLRGRFEAGAADTEFSVDVFRAVVPSVSDRVGRQMEIRNASRSSRVVEAGNNTTGVLSLRFTWTNFSRVEEDRVVVDSFSTQWFGDLAPNQTLTLRSPEGYDTENVLPPTSIVENGYRWSGPHTFDADRPFAVFTENDSVVGVSMVVLVAVGVLALFAGAATVWAYYRDGDERPVPWLRDVRRAVASRVREALSAESESEAEESAADADAAAGSAAAEPAASGASDDADSEPTDPELLSDEERVERLLREHGGRMKQSEIVEETRWSTAKVSQLLSSMAEDGRVEKLRIGRENLISLPGEGVDNGIDEE